MEFASRTSKSGSAYTYTYLSIGEFAAYTIGWNLVLEYVIGTASEAKAISNQFDSLVGNYYEKKMTALMPIHCAFLADYPDFIAAGITVTMTGLISYGVAESTRLNSIFTFLNLSTVGAIVICGIGRSNFANWTIRRSDIPEAHRARAGAGGFAPFGLNGIIVGAAKCFFGFVGFDCIATTGEEAKNPKRNIPLSILLSLLVVFLCFFAIALVLTLIIPYYEQDADAPFPHIFDVLGLPLMKWVVTIGSLFALLTGMFGALFPLPRILYAMSQDGLLYPSFAYVSPRTKTPVVSSVLSGLLTAVLSAIFKLDQLVDMLSIGTLLAYTIVAISVLILRYSEDEETGNIKTESLEYIAESAHGIASDKYEYGHKIPNTDTGAYNNYTITNSGSNDRCINMDSYLTSIDKPVMNGHVDTDASFVSRQNTRTSFKKGLVLDQKSINNLAHELKRDPLVNSIIRKQETQQMSRKKQQISHQTNHISHESLFASHRIRCISLENKINLVKLSSLQTDLSPGGKIRLNSDGLELSYDGLEANHDELGLSNDAIGVSGSRDGLEKPDKSHYQGDELNNLEVGHSIQTSLWEKTLEIETNDIGIESNDTFGNGTNKQEIETNENRTKIPLCSGGKDFAGSCDGHDGTDSIGLDSEHSDEHLADHLAHVTTPDGFSDDKIFKIDLKHVCTDGFTNDEVTSESKPIGEQSEHIDCTGKLDQPHIGHDSYSVNTRRRKSVDNSKTTDSGDKAYTVQFLFSSSEVKTNEDSQVSELTQNCSFQHNYHSQEHPCETSHRHQSKLSQTFATLFNLNSASPAATPQSQQLSKMCISLFIVLTIVVCLLLNSVSNVDFDLEGASESNATLGQSSGEYMNYRTARAGSSGVQEKYDLKLRHATYGSHPGEKRRKSETLADFITRELLRILSTVAAAFSQSESSSRTSYLSSVADTKTSIGFQTVGERGGASPTFSLSPLKTAIYIVVMAAYLTLFLVLCRQNQTRPDCNFKVPLVPLLPCLSIFMNVYLMINLDVSTWVRFVVWMVVGMGVYFTYGIRNSKLKTA